MNYELKKILLMKKIFTLCLGLVAALAVQAQSDFPVQFTDKDGNIIADGTTLDLTETEETDFGEIQMPTGLYVKNISEASVHTGGIFTIQSISSGAFQSCPFGTCTRNDKKGEYTTADNDLAAGATDFLSSEWFPETDGTCTVVYQLITYKQNAVTKKWNKDKEGPKITLNFTYNTTHVATAKNGKAIDSTQYFDLQGRRIAKPTTGMLVKKTVFTDGSVTVQKQRIQ